MRSVTSLLLAGLLALSFAGCSNNDVVGVDLAEDTEVAAGTSVPGLWGTKNPGSKIEGKVDVCHLTGDGTYVLITIADPALPAHIAHGDLEAPDVMGEMGLTCDDWYVGEGMEEGEF